MTRWDDIVFANRNQAFGAYTLRMNYHRRLFLGMVLAATGISLLLLLIYFTNHHALVEEVEVIITNTQEELPAPIQLPAEQEGVSKSIAEEEVAPPSQDEFTGELSSTSKGSLALPDVPLPSTPASLSLPLAHGDSEFGSLGEEHMGSDLTGGGTESGLLASSTVDSHAGDLDYYLRAKYMNINFNENQIIHYTDRTPTAVLPIIKDRSSGGSSIDENYYWLLHKEYNGQFTVETSYNPGFTLYHWSYAYVRVHPEYIVHIAQIRWVTETEVILTNDIRVPLSPLYLETIKSALNGYASKFAYTAHGQLIKTIKEHLPTKRSIHEWEQEEERTARIAKKWLRHQRLDLPTEIPRLAEAPEILSRYLHGLSVAREKNEVMIIVPSLTFVIPSITPSSVQSPAHTEEELYRPYGEPDITLSLNETQQVGRSLAEVLQSRVPGILVSGNKVFFRSSASGIQVTPGSQGKPSNYQAGLSLGSGSQEPLVLLNGIPSSIEVVNTIPVGQIHAVDIISGANSAFFGSRGAFGIISVFTKTRID